MWASSFSQGAKWNIFKSINTDSEKEERRASLCFPESESSCQLNAMEPIHTCISINRPAPICLHGKHIEIFLTAVLIGHLLSVTHTKSPLKASLSMIRGLLSRRGEEVCEVLRKLETVCKESHRETESK